jgi:hypothetical protein
MLLDPFQDYFLVQGFSHQRIDKLWAVLIAIPKVCSLAEVHLTLTLYRNIYDIYTSGCNYVHKRNFLITKFIRGGCSLCPEICTLMESYLVLH